MKPEQIFEALNLLKEYEPNTNRIEHFKEIIVNIIELRRISKLSPPLREDAKKAMEHIKIVLKEVDGYRSTIKPSDSEEQEISRAVNEVKSLGKRFQRVLDASEEDYQAYLRFWEFKGKVSTVFESSDFSAEEKKDKIVEILKNRNENLPEYFEALASAMIDIIDITREGPPTTERTDRAEQKLQAIEDKHPILPQSVRDCIEDQKRQISRLKPVEPATSYDEPWNPNVSTN